MQARKRPERRQAVQEAKQAVRAYAREPSRANADAVELAWRKVRQCDTLAEWRWGVRLLPLHGEKPYSLMT
jgi:hypothetical protein